MNFEEIFPKGILHPELFLGVASLISARSIGVNLSAAGYPSGSHYSGARYGRGEVGEFVLIEGQQNIILGRISEVKLREPERRSVRPDFAGREELDAIGHIQLLGCVSMHNLQVITGVDSYPRLGDRIYAAPHKFISLLPYLMEQPNTDTEVALELGHIGATKESKVFVKPEKLFGRHCAILGATGGGKSWTTARIIEECLKHNCKIVLLDATGEYRGFEGPFVQNCHLGSPVQTAKQSEECSLPPTCFTESDFMAIFEPSGKSQLPKLKEAITSLRLVTVDPTLMNTKYGGIKKEHEKSDAFHTAVFKHAKVVNDPKAPFDFRILPHQIIKECVYDEGDRWGNKNNNEISWCASLVSRINNAFKSPVFKCVFDAEGKKTVVRKIESFLQSDNRLLRICMSGIGYEFKAREILSNVIGRYFLNSARDGMFKDMPVVLIIDEAHNFLGKQVGSEENVTKLDAFEIIAREGRKYGLNICLATQRPRDITEGVLSQMGTLIVHRLTNDSDREVVERACGEIDRAASAFLPNLRPGEAAIIGTDFPIPLTIQIEPPSTCPKSDGPNYQDKWKITLDTKQATSLNEDDDKTELNSEISENASPAEDEALQVSEN